jgi:hypothetical protein
MDTRSPGELPLTGAPRQEQNVPAGRTRGDVGSVRATLRRWLARAPPRRRRIHCRRPPAGVRPAGEGPREWRARGRGAQAGRSAQPSAGRGSGDDEGRQGRSRVPLSPTVTPQWRRTGVPLLEPRLRKKGSTPGHWAPCMAERTSPSIFVNPLRAHPETADADRSEAPRQCPGPVPGPADPSAVCWEWPAGPGTWTPACPRRTSSGTSRPSASGWCVRTTLPPNCGIRSSPGTACGVIPRNWPSAPSRFRWRAVSSVATRRFSLGKTALLVLAIGGGLVVYDLLMSLNESSF